MVCECGSGVITGSGTTTVVHEYRPMDGIQTALGARWHCSDHAVVRQAKGRAAAVNQCGRQAFTFDSDL